MRASAFFILDNNDPWTCNKDLPEDWMKAVNYTIFFLILEANGCWWIKKGDEEELEKRKKITTTGITVQKAGLYS